MNLFAKLSLILFLSSCAATRYGAVVGGQYTNYNESSSVSSLLGGGGGPEIEDYETSGPGFHVGFSEETQSILTKITYFQNRYEDSEYVVDGNKSDASLSESGFRGTVAWKLGPFQPYFGFVSYNFDAEVDGESETSNASTITFGADLEIQVSKRGFFYLGYGVDSVDNLSVVEGYTVDQTIEHGTFVLGYRHNFSDSYTK